MKNNNFVEFEISGGYFKTSYLKDKNGRKLYLSADAAKRDGLPETTDRIITWSDGSPIGNIELSVKGKRVLRVPKEETKVIEAICYHEFVDSVISKSSSPKLVMKDLTAVDNAKREKLEKSKIVNTIYVNLSDEEIDDLGVVLGYPADDAAIRIDDLKNSKPDLFLTYFKEPFKKGNGWFAKLKEETVVGAVLKRAILKKIVTVKAGSISFEDTIVGSDFNTAVTNMMDTTKQGKADILALIKAKLEKA